MNRMRAVYEASYTRLVGQLYGVCGDLAEAEDVVQEAFVRAMADPRRFDALDNPEAWLRTAAVNRARSRARRRQLAERILGHHREVVAPVGAPEERIALVAALRRLPWSQREALGLHYLADLPVHEVAATLGVPVGTVKARLSRGRSALAAVIKVEDEDEVRR